MGDRIVTYKRRKDDMGNRVVDVLINDVKVDTIFRDPATTNWYSVYRSSSNAPWELASTGTLDDLKYSIEHGSDLRYTSGKTYKSNPSPKNDKKFRRIAHALISYVLKVLSAGDMKQAKLKPAGYGYENMVVEFPRIKLKHISADMPFRLAFGPLAHGTSGEHYQFSGLIAINMPARQAYEWERLGRVDLFKNLALYLRTKEKTLFHEIIHLLDARRKVRMREIDVTDKKAYYNDPAEMNAHTQTAFMDLERRFSMRSWSLPEALHSFIYFYGHPAPNTAESQLPFYKLTVKNQKRLIKRLAVFWADFYKA